MARSKKVADTPKSTAPKTRGIDLQEVEARVTALDKAKRRSYDIFDIEQRVYNLEKNSGGGGGGDTGVKIETGTLTAGASNTPVEVTLSDIKGTPDLIICKCLYLGEYLNMFVFIRPMHTESSSAGNYWHNISEGSVYISDMTGNNNGVKSVSDGKFTFNTDGTFTGATITFTAYCWTEE